jgi:hypothetical protein
VTKTGIGSTRNSLRILPPHVTASRSRLAELQREFTRLRALEHPHIARLIELGSNGSQYFVRGERLAGETLRVVLQHLFPERVDIAEADEIVLAIGAALSYAHAQGVVHGDVRAEHVLVTMDRRFVLTDFLARRLDKNAGAALKPIHDVRGLARLAAELYTGATSSAGLRGADCTNVPPARVTAIREVLDGAAQDAPQTIAEFLAVAELPFAGAAARPPSFTRQIALNRWGPPATAAIIAAAVIVASFRASETGALQELQQRGLDALGIAAPASEQAAPLPAPLPAADAVPEAGAPRVAPSTEPEIRPAAEPPAFPASPPAQAPARDAQVAAADDPAVLSMAAARVAAREDNSVVAIEVLRSGDTTGEAAVRWSTEPDTAQEDDDYASAGAQTVTFSAGATVGRVLIPLVNDGLPESNEAFTVQLEHPRNAVSGALTATRVTLVDDD